MVSISFETSMKMLGYIKTYAIHFISNESLMWLLAINNKNNFIFIFNRKSFFCLSFLFLGEVFSFQIMKSYDEQNNATGLERNGQFS